MQRELAALLSSAEEEIVAQWSRDLKATSFQGYSDRPLDELESDCRQCLQGYIAAIGEGDQSKLRRFIHREVRARISQGFRPSEIARKFCAFEPVAWPLVAERYSSSSSEQASALARLRQCVTSALFEFSDMYETASQQRVEEYMTEVETMNRRLEEISVRDALTGLYNRRYVMDRLANEFKRAHRHNRPLSLIMLDVDHFKSINDSYGHQVGDEVLRGIGLMVVNQTRTTDIGARYGGEEFIAVLPETHVEGALKVAEKLREAVALAPLHRVQISGGSEAPVHCTVSLGVSSHRPDVADMQALIHEADNAMYVAKRTGRNRVLAAWNLSPSDAVALPVPVTAPA